MDLPEIEQILDDKYHAMKHVKGWDEEKDDYALFTIQSNKKKPKKAFKVDCGYCGKFGHKATECPDKDSNQNKAQKENLSKKEEY